MREVETNSKKKSPLAGVTGSLLGCGGGVGRTFGRRCCCDDDGGDGLWGACCHVLLKLLRWNGLNANLKQIKVQTVID